MPCYNRLEPKYSTASADVFILIHDILLHHLRKQDEAGFSSSELMYSHKIDPWRCYSKKETQKSGSGEETRVYMYTLALKFLTVPRLNHQQSAEVGDTTYEHSITDQLQLRTETKAKHQLEEKLATETQARTQLEKDFTESPFQWHTAGKVFKLELDALYQAGGPFTDGLSTHNFSLSMLSYQLLKHSPHLHAIMSTLNCSYDDSAQGHTIHNIRSITALSILARRSNKMKRFAAISEPHAHCQSSRQTGDN